VLSTLSIDSIQITWLKIDVGLPRVLRCRTALPTPGCRRLCPVPRRPRRGLSLTDGTVCDDPPPVLLELCENIMARSAIFSRKCGE
jgi:hypothetical protein